MSRRQAVKLMVIVLGPGQSGLLSDSLVEPPKILLCERTSAAGDRGTDLRKLGRELPTSVRLRAGELDYFGPLLGFFSVALSILVGRQCKHFAAKLGKAGLDRRVGEGGVHVPVKRVDDFGRHVLRRADTGPRARLETRHEVAQYGDVREPLPTRRGGHRQRARPAGPDMFDGGGHG